MTTAVQATTRDATVDDLMALSHMGVRFVEWSPFAGLGGIDRDGIVVGFLGLMDSGGFLRVAERDGEIIGFLAGMTGLWFAPDAKIAAELGYWVEPAHRRGTAAGRLILEFVAWAKAGGMERVALSDLDAQTEMHAGDLYASLGFEQVERVWIKRIA